MKRRDFLTLSACSPLLTIASSPANASPIPNEAAVGLLYDSALCINCQSCVSACKYVNKMDPQLASDNNDVWVINSDLSSNTLSVIKQFPTANSSDKSEVNLLKRQCMHCLEPSCVSACPVSALTKDPITGIVNYNQDACIGCRYCVAACPFGVPQFELSKAQGMIQKCQLCNQPELARIGRGLLPACAEVCPVGATVFGTREELLVEAKKRLAAAPNAMYDYPIASIDSSQTNRQAIPSYQDHIYGEFDGGGTQVLYLAAVPFEQLQLPKLGQQSAASRSERLQTHMTSSVPLIALAGLALVHYRRRVSNSCRVQKNENEND